jgi:PAS domain S-box-containing protein
MLNAPILKETLVNKIYYNSPDGIFIADSTGRYIDVNPSGCEITGYTYEEITNMSLLDITHPDSTNEVINIFKNLKSTGKISSEFKYLKKDGTIFYMQVDAVKIEEETYIAFCKDTTIRKLNEEACTELAIRKELEAELVKKKRQLEIKNEELEAIMESMSDGLFMLDKNYDFEFLNQRGLDFFYEPEKIKSGASFSHTKYYDMKGKLLQIEDMVGSKVLKGEKIKNWRIKAERPDKTLYFSMSGNPIYDEHGEIAAAIICCRDITEEKENEDLIYLQQEQLLKTEKEKNEALIVAIEMKDEFLSIISHEFKTPLTVINSAIQAMELICRDELSVKGKDFVKKIKQNAFRQLRLVNNLLDITRANAGHIKLHKSSVDIVFFTKSIVDSVNIYALQKEIEIQYTASMKKKTIYLDEEKYERIILNLISNAIKFTPKGRSITVSVFTKVIKKRNNICIKVIDTGVGIPQDKQSLIFERFGQVDSSLTRQAEGTGIGLSLVKKLVEAHEGEIHVDSEIGRGSTFTILLPIEKECEQAEAKKFQESKDNRLIQSAAIEFSDIYF